MKKYIFTVIIAIIASFCIFSPLTVITAAKSGLSLWATIIIPSLFPFMIIADLIQRTALPFLFGKIFNPVMKPLFNLPGITSVAIFLGMSGGYPIGAKISADMANEKSISPKEANHLITFVNNSGPLFILGAVGIGIYKSAPVGFLLLISHYLSALIVGLLFRIFFNNESASINKLQYTPPIKFQVIKLSEIGVLLNNTIKKSIDIVLSIGGFIVLFSIISAILEEFGILNILAKTFLPFSSLETSKALITGLLEVTTGVNKIATIQIPLLYKLLITSALIGFGGISIHFQSLSVLSKSYIKPKMHFWGKFLHCILSSLLTFILLYFTKFSEIIALSVSAVSYNSTEFSEVLNTIIGFAIFSIIFKIFQTIYHQ